MEGNNVDVSVGGGNDGVSRVLRGGVRLGNVVAISASRRMFNQLFFFATY